MNYLVETVLDGAAVIDRMKQFMPDLCLVDVVLPNKTGYVVLQEKSFDRDITKIPTIVVSNSGSPLQMREIPSTPMIRDYIVKSHIEPEEVVEKIEKIFGMKVDSTAPQQNSSTQKSAAAPSAATPSAAKKVLWVEDDKLLGTILTKKMTSTGYTLLKASNDTQAWEILAKDTPDVIVLDIMLPEVSGLDILQKIKKEEKYKKIPVIMLSNLSKQSDIERAKALGANRFIVKAAVSLDEIIREIGNLVK